MAASARRRARRRLPAAHRHPRRSVRSTTTPAPTRSPISPARSRPASRRCSGVGGAWSPMTRSWPDAQTSRPWRSDGPRPRQHEPADRSRSAQRLRTSPSMRQLPCPPIAPTISRSSVHDSAEKTHKRMEPRYRRGRFLRPESFAGPCSSRGSWSRSVRGDSTRRRGRFVWRQTQFGDASLGCGGSGLDPPVQARTTARTGGPLGHCCDRMIAAATAATRSGSVTTATSSRRPPQVHSRRSTEKTRLRRSQCDIRP